MLFVISFLYTEQAVNVVRELDEIMIKIKEVKTEYEIKPIDAVITYDEIIPGINGKKVDEEKSYHNMRRLNQFNPNLFEYNEISPAISIKNNFQKYVVAGNPKKNNISLIFVVKQDDDIENVLEILKQKKVTANFFIDGKWLENNSKQSYNIVENGNILGNLEQDSKENDSLFTWVDNIIKKLTKQDNYYCYTEEKNNDNLKTCAIYKNYSIKPNLIIKSSPLREIKETIKPGSIISFPIDDLVLDELGTVINYIKAKGYKIVNLDQHLNEQLDN